MKYDQTTSLRTGESVYNPESLFRSFSGFFKLINDDLNKTMRCITFVM